jgi:hypothetical protein
LVYLFDSQGGDVLVVSKSEITYLALPGLSAKALGQGIVTRRAKPGLRALSA